MKWVTLYLGKEWEARSHGPDSYDCWTLVSDIYFRKLGIVLPTYFEIPRTPCSALVEKFSKVEKLGWRKVLDKVDFDLLLVREPGKEKAHHCGLWFGEDQGLFLHCSPLRGVVADSMRKVKRDWVITGRYRYGFDC